jgi:hypothetical protein
MNREIKPLNHAVHCSNKQKSTKFDQTKVYAGAKLPTVIKLVCISDFKRSLHSLKALRLCNKLHAGHYSEVFVGFVLFLVLFS